MKTLALAVMLALVSPASAGWRCSEFADTVNCSGYGENNGAHSTTRRFGRDIVTERFDGGGRTFERCHAFGRQLFCDGR